DAQVRALRRFREIRAVVGGGDLHEPARLCGRSDQRELASREQLRRGRLSLRGFDTQRIEAKNDRGIRGDGGPIPEGRVPVLRDGAGPGDDVLLEIVPELDEQRALTERNDARLHGQMIAARTFTPAPMSASRTAAPISGAPGVSPWMHSVSTAIFRNEPSCACTPPSRANESACFAASFGSVCSAPGSLRERSVPSFSYARSAKPSRTTRNPPASAASASADFGAANSATSVRAVKTFLTPATIAFAIVLSCQAWLYSAPCALTCEILRSGSTARSARICRAISSLSSSGSIAIGSRPKFSRSGYPGWAPTATL